MIKMPRGHCLAASHTTLSTAFLRHFDLALCSAVLFPTHTAPVLRGSGEMAPVLQLSGGSAGQGRHGRSGTET